MIRDIKTKINGIDLHIIDYGGSGDTVICVHGLTANARFWDAIAEPLSEVSRVIALDLRGRGDSEKPKDGYNLEQHASDIIGVLDFFQINKIVYLGHSLGAMIGACFAANYSDRLTNLILIDGGEDLHPEIHEVLQPSIKRLGKIYQSFEQYCDQMKQIPFFQPWNEFLSQYFYSDVHHLGDGTVKTKTSKNVALSELEALKNKSINSYHEHIKVPTLIFYAPNCLLHPRAFLITKEKGLELASILPNSFFIEVSNSNHFSIVFKEHKIVVEEIKRFLGYC